MPAQTRLAALIAKEEGFGIPGAIPTVRHNMGDLRHSPHSQHPAGPDDVGTIDTDEHGWQDLERQLRIYAERRMPPDGHLMTLREMVYVYAPPADHNRSDVYLDFICHGLGLRPSDTVAHALTIPA